MKNKLSFPSREEEIRTLFNKIVEKEGLPGNPTLEFFDEFSDSHYVMKSQTVFIPRILTIPKNAKGTYTKIGDPFKVKHPVEEIVSDDEEIEFIIYHELGHHVYRQNPTNRQFIFWRKIAVSAGVMVPSFLSGIIPLGPSVLLNKPVTHFYPITGFLGGMISVGLAVIIDAMLSAKEEDFANQFAVDRLGEERLYNYVKRSRQFKFDPELQEKMKGLPWWSRGYYWTADFCEKVTCPHTYAKYPKVD